MDELTSWSFIEMEMVIGNENIPENKCMICCFKRQTVFITQDHNLCHLLPPCFRSGLSRGWDSFFSLPPARKLKPCSVSHMFIKSVCTWSGSSSLRYPSNFVVVRRFDHSWICATETSGEVKCGAAVKEKSLFWVQSVRKAYENCDTILNWASQSSFPEMPLWAEKKCFRTKKGTIAWIMGYKKETSSLQGLWNWRLSSKTSS